MSWASSGVTPRSGIALPGSIACGFSIHRCRLGPLLTTLPAMYERLPNLVSGGPTRPSAPLTPGTVWQEPQPYPVISCAPRPGSPEGPSAGGAGDRVEQAAGATTRAPAAAIGHSHRSPSFLTP